MSELGPSPTFAHGHAHGPGAAPRPQMPPDGRAYFDPQHVLPGTSLSPTKAEHHPPGSAAVPPSRKRARESMSTDDKPKIKAGSPTPPKDSKDGLPSILVREKKQKACANCRRAKLKCIVEDGETDCVRCRARKERCVFYPRGHDEDWQQTLTGDVYAAIRHLTHLSTTVHHILDHLVLHGIVPPIDKPLERFDAPEREMALLQGWGAERNRELVGPEGRKRARKGKKEEEMDDDDDAEPLPQPFDYGAGVDLQRRTSNGMPPTVMRPSDMQMPMNNGYDRVSTSPETTMRPLAGPQTAPQGFRNPSANSVMVNTEVDMTSFNNYNLTPNGRNAQGGPATGETGAATTTGTGVTPETAGISSISPVDHGSFPGMVMESGASAGNQQQSTALVSPGAGAYNPGQGIFGLLNGAKANGGPQPPSPPVPSFQTDSLGSADPRPNIVKRGLIANGDALSLVNYFHSRLSPWLFGYRLQFTKFPYIPQGPSVITPFILSVMCLVAAERVPNMHEHRPTLAREVTQLLVNSPADSFISTLDQPFGGGSGNKDDDGEEELDPELGIGPEEIVGACILATFMTEREQAATIASSAFKWARGWIKWTSLTVPLPPTLGEVCGLLPVKRDATREDMARVWLLCYIVDGTEALQRDNPAAPRRDPMAYCHVLVPDSPLPGDSYSPHDILLTFHARLITLLRDWYHRRSQSEAAIAGAGAGAQAAAHARLASSINASLEWWRADLESHSLAAEWMRHVDLFWEFARMLVNATSAKSLSANPRLRAASWAHGVEAAVGLLEKCSSWPSRDELANLPPCYLSMITLAGSVLVDAIKDQGVAECPFQADDAVPLLKDVADMLGSGGLPHQHVSRTAGATLRGYAEQLSRFV